MNSTDQARLVIEGGPDNDETIRLPEPSTTMERGSNNDVVVDIAGVSRRHARIFDTDAGYFLSDLSSTNGTFVNGERVMGVDHLLSDGDKIRLGQTAVAYVFRYQEADTLQLRQDRATPQNMGEESGIFRPVRQAADSEAEPAGVALASPDSAEPEEEEALFEGTVRLIVHVGGGVGLAVSFTQQLNEMSEIRVLRLASILDGGMDIWLSLRQPIPMAQILAKMDGVVSVGTNVASDLGSSGEEPLLTVLLRPTPRPSTIVSEPEPPSAKPAASLPSPVPEVKPYSPHHNWARCVYCKEPLGPSTIVCPNCRKTQA